MQLELKLWLRRFHVSESQKSAGTSQWTGAAAFAKLGLRPPTAENSCPP